MPEAPRPAPEHETRGDDDLAQAVESASEWFVAGAQHSKTLLQLAAAEARLAATSFAWLIAIATSIAILVLAVWGLAAAGLIGFAVEQGVPMWASLLGMAAVHAAVAYWLLRKGTRLEDNLAFPATRERLSRQSGEPAANDNEAG